MAGRQLHALEPLGDASNRRGPGLEADATDARPTEGSQLRGTRAAGVVIRRKVFVIRPRGDG
jgi:hypothetical protein